MEGTGATGARENWRSGPADTGILEGCDLPGEAEAGRNALLSSGLLDVPQGQLIVTSGV